jgi:hypothetical protein
MVADLLTGCALVGVILVMRARRRAFRARPAG